MRNKKTALIFLLTSSFLLLSCKSQETIIVEKIAEANENLSEGKLDQAIGLLETLNSRYEREAEIKEALAFAYAEKKDYQSSAQMFSEIAGLDENKAHFLLNAANILESAGKLEEAAGIYVEFLEHEPESSQGWRTLGRINKSLNKPREAIKYYLESYRIVPNGKSAVQLGNLFAKLANIPNSESWYQTAIELDDGSELEAFLGLLSIAMEKNNPEYAQKIVLHLDQAHPGELDVSNFASVRSDLARWKEQQAALKRELKEQEKLATELREKEAAARRAEAEAAARRAEAEAAARRAEKQLIDKEEEGHESDAGNPLSSLANARRLKSEGLLDEAVAQYWEVIKLDDTSGSIWSELSSSYLQSGQESWAEATALEAIRRDPLNSHFNLQYLTAVRQTKDQFTYLEELKKTKEKLRNSPEITLALARAYREISGGALEAAALYQEFLILAPTHPDREIVEAELTNLPETIDL